MSRSMFWKISSLLIVIVIMVAACAPAATTAPTIAPTQPPKEVTKIVESTKLVESTKIVEATKLVQVKPILYNSYNGDPKPRAFDEAIVKAFNAKNPTMPVEQSIIAHEDFKQAIRAYLTASPAPDVLTWFAGNRTRFFIDKGLVADITDAWNKAGFNESFATGFQALASYKDKKYFLPTSYYWWAIYYRPSLFKQAGIDKAPETWEQLLTACDKLNAAKITPFTIGARFKWPAAAWFDYLNMRINGPQFHIDLTDLKVSYTDPKVKKVFEYWKQMIDRKCFIKDPAALDWQEAIPDMVQGKAAMYLMGQFIVDSYPDDKEADLDFFRFPIIDPAQKVGEDAPTDGFFVAKNAKNMDGAAAFLAYLGSKEVEQKAFDELGRLPTRKDVDISKATAATQKGIKLIQAADIIAQFYDRDTTPPMAEAGMDGIMKFWSNPADIDNILKNLEAERQRNLKEAQK